MHPLESLVQTYIDDKVFPGVSLGWIRRDGTRQIFQAGRTTYEEHAPLVTSQTIFDCASLTKTFPTTTLALLLEREGIWKLSDPLQSWLPQWHGDERVAIEDLVFFRPEFTLTLSRLKNLSPDELLSQILTAPLARPLEKHHRVYSNTTSILLTLAMENASGKTLPEVAQEKLFDPLHLQRTSFFPRSQFALEAIAPTEMDPWRGHILQGEVHDESAWILQQAGHVMGSAGVFSCVDDILTFLHWHMLSGLGNRGWESFSPEWMGTHAHEESYGKTGFTGCCMMIDPEDGIGYVVLSNAVHPTRPARGSFNAVRQELLTRLLQLAK